MIITKSTGMIGQRLTHESRFLISMISEREREILSYMSLGNTSLQIATLLFISEHTVISHRKNLMSKLHARNSAHLIFKAVRLGLLT